MSDKLIRQALLRALQQADPTAIVREEFPLCRGKGRADCASINGSLIGYEIKSDIDSLARLPQQFPLYESVFDYCYVVAAPKHLLAVSEMVPKHWGIHVAAVVNGVATIHDVRKAKRNNATSLSAIIRLMWKPEVLQSLRELGKPVSHDTPISALWDMLETCPKGKVAKLAIEALKARSSSPVDLQRVQDDGSQPIEATAEHRLALG